MYGHDPYLFAFMRACNVPRIYYPQYLKELTPTRKRRHRTARAPNHTAPELRHPSQLDWVTPNHIALAERYLAETKSVAQCQQHVDAAVRKLTLATNPYQQAGAKRMLIYMQARLLASLSRGWEDVHGNVLTADNYKQLIARATPFTESVVNDARRFAQEKIVAARAKEKYLTKLRRRWDELKEQYAVVRRAYLTAKARLRVAHQKAERARAAARVSSGNYHTHTPTPALQAIADARSALVTATQHRNRVQREWRACKDKLRRLNKVGSS